MTFDNLKQYAFFMNRLATYASYLKEIYFTSLVCFQFEVHNINWSDHLVSCQLQIFLFCAIQGFSLLFKKLLLAFYLPFT